MSKENVERHVLERDIRKVEKYSERFPEKVEIKQKTITLLDVNHFDNWCREDD